MWLYILFIVVCLFYFTDGYLAIGNKWIKYSWSAKRAKKRNRQIKTYFTWKRKIKKNPNNYNLSRIKRMYDGEYLNKNQCKKFCVLWCKLMGYDINITL
jgi:hypothetical protein